MAVEKPNVIDLIAHDPKREIWTLVIVEEREWDGSVGRMREIQAKVEAYLEFALDGPMTEKYPDSAGKAKRIEFTCWTQPEGSTAEFLGKLAQFVRNYGMEFQVSLLPPKK